MTRGERWLVAWVALGLAGFVAVGCSSAITQESFTRRDGGSRAATTGSASTRPGDAGYDGGTSVSTGTVTGPAASGTLVPTSGATTNGSRASTSSAPSVTTSNTGTASSTTASSTTASSPETASTSSARSATSTSAFPSLTVTPGAVMLDPGGLCPAEPSTIQLTAIATLGDGATENVTAQSTWTSSDSSVATVGADTGLVTAVGFGVCVITASDAGLTSNATVTVAGPALASIDVAPLSATTYPGGTRQFTATGMYPDGTSCDITSSVTWDSSPADVAAVSPFGLATGLLPGVVTISATVEPIAGTATLTVSSPPPPEVIVTPASVNLGPAGLCSAQLTATAVLSDGSMEDVTTTATWVSSDTSIAAVGVSSGVVVSVAPSGTAEVTATYQQVSGTAVVSVAGGTLVSIGITPTAASIAEGSTQQYDATASFSGGTSCDATGQVTWESSQPAIATISSLGLATAGTTTGTSSITATSGAVVSTPETLTVE